MQEPTLRWVAGTCPPPDGIGTIRRRESDELHSCPTVYDVEGTDDVIVQGYELDDAMRARLGIPPGETANRLPKAVLRAAAEGLGER